MGLEVLNSEVYIDPETVAIVEKVLSDVRAGRVTNVAIVAMGPSGAYNSVAKGPLLANLYCALDLLLENLRAQFSGQKRSSLFRM
jgi:hypothetical protein